MNDEQTSILKIPLNLKDGRSYNEESLLSPRIILPERFLSDMVKELFLN